MSLSLRLAGSCAAVIIVSPIATLRAQVAPRAGIAQAEVSLGRDWLEVHFPPLSAAEAGCPYVNALAGGRLGRHYQWRVTADFRDRRDYDNHFMGVYVSFGIPDTARLTSARLDSALAEVRITVDEARGEPPMTAAQVVPTRAQVRRDGDRLILRVEGRAAVRAFTRARSDSVDVGWCQRDDLLAGTRVALRRR